MMWVPTVCQALVLGIYSHQRQLINIDQSVSHGMDTRLTTLKRVGVAQNYLLCDFVHLGSKNLGF